MNKAAQRIALWREKMRDNGIQATLVPTADRHASEYVPEHDQVRKWLSGFTGSAGTLVVGQEEAALFTDGRYFIQAEQQLQGSGIALMRIGMPGVPSASEYLADLAAGGKAGANLQLVSLRQAEALQRQLEKKGAGLVDIGDWAEELWKDRPPLPMGAAYALDDAVTGRTAAEKLAELRAKMQERGAQAHLTNVLDDIAWLLNVRGSDVPCTPVVMSFLLVTGTEATWFVDPGKVDGALRAKLSEAGVAAAPYDDVTKAVSALPEDARVMIAPACLTADLAGCIPRERQVRADNPALLMKAVKNETELTVLRDAHLRDGLALTRFMYWLKTGAGRVPMTEISVSERLEAFRREDEAYVMPSFETICAYGAHAAMMHYSATPESDAVIEPKGLLLIDSGGQYPGATTDVTRTFAMGPVEETQKIHFTAVVESVLRLSEARFLRGMCGWQLDVLARGPIWDLGIDYRCGTGHGVGSMLCVHEGPNSFRWRRTAGRTEEAVIVPGMVTTDEPGIYIEGSHGIRTENELVCRSVQENEYGEFLTFDTVTCVPIDLDALLPERLSAKARDALNAYHRWVRTQLSPRMATEAERAWLETATRAV